MSYNFHWQVQIKLIKEGLKKSQNMAEKAFKFKKWVKQVNLKIKTKNKF